MLATRNPVSWEFIATLAFRNRAARRPATAAAASAHKNYTRRLRGVPIGDAGVEALSQLKNLKTLVLNKDSKISVAGRQRLRQALPGCKVSP
jgi:hypothetical protein